MSDAHDAVRDAFAQIIASRTPLVAGRMHETALRAAKAWQFKTAGYDADPLSFVREFELGAENVRGMVLVRDIEIESLCEHHLERVWGYAHIGYIPLGKVLGLSKFYRLANAFARRMQLQEKLTAQIADTLMHALAPIGVGVVIEARHSCMETRGICKRGQITTTSELRGDFYADPSTRAEFLALARTTKPF